MGGGGGSSDGTDNVGSVAEIVVEAAVAETIVEVTVLVMAQVAVAAAAASEWLECLMDFRHQ